MKFAGALFLLKVGDAGSPESFQTVAGQRSGSHSLGNAQIDVTSKDGSRWRQLLEGGVRNLDITCSGVLQNAAAHQLLTELARTGEIRNYQLVFSDGWTFEAPFQIQTWGGQGEYTDSQQYELQLLSAHDATLDTDTVPPAVIQFVSATYSADATDPSVTLTVQRTGTLTTEVSVDYGFAAGVAQAGLDYTGTPGTVTFAANETVKTIVVPLIEPDYDEEIAASEPWAYWKLNEASGTAVADSSGNSRPLAVAAGSIDWAEASLNATGALSASFQPGTRADREPAGLVGNIDFTIEGWFVLDAGGSGTRALFSVGGITSDASADYNWQFMLNITGGGVFQTFWEHGLGVNETTQFPEFSITPGVPFYATAGRNTGNSTTFLRINDADVVAKPYTNAPDGGADVRIEVGNQRSNDASLDGRASQVAVYTEALTLNRYGRWRTGAARTFSVSLSDPTAGAELGVRDTSTVTISP